MEKENNKVRVSLVGVVCAHMYLWAGVLAYIVTRAWGNDTITPLSEVVFVIMLLMLPSAVFLGLYITNGAYVTIDENGLHRAFLGRFFRKSILWEEILCVSVKRTWNPHFQWFFFSKSDITAKSINECALMRDNIHIQYSPELNELVKKYYGKEILPLED